LKRVDVLTEDMMIQNKKIKNRLEPFKEERVKVAKKGFLISS
jgi:hypothetical protein